MPPSMNHEDDFMPNRTGYTLIEILTATILSLMLLGTVITVYATVSDSMNETRSVLKKADEIQAARTTLQSDLSGITVSVVPIRDVGERSGHLEIQEGPAGSGERRGGNLPEYQRLTPSDPDKEDKAVAVNLFNGEIDLTVCDNDDILMFTTQSAGKPFTGRALYKRAPFPGESATSSDSIGDFVLERTVQSELAEVIWFVRGRTLYRRVLLILPDFDADLRTPGQEVQLSMQAPYLEISQAGVDPGTGFYAYYDISVHNTVNPATGKNYLTPNSLSDLSRREFRYAHQNTFDHSMPHLSYGVFPYDARQWGLLGMPTLHECSYGVKDDGTFYDTPWVAGMMVHGEGGYYDDIDWDAEDVVVPKNRDEPPDFWLNPHPWKNVDVAGDTSIPISDYDTIMGVDFTSGTWTPNVDNPSSSAPFAFMGSWVSEDVILTNVIGFDVKVWDPMAPVLAHCPSGDEGSCVILEPGDLGYPHPADERNFIDTLNAAYQNATDGNDQNDFTSEWCIVWYGAFVDLNYANDLSSHKDAKWAKTPFDGPGNPMSQLNGYYEEKDKSGAVVNTYDGYHSLLDKAPKELLDRIASTCIYDTWSTIYESNWLDLNGDGVPNTGDFGDEDGDGYFDEGTDGLDNDSNGIVDDIGERETLPPYPVPLRGIQVKIRVYEPDSQQIREVTVARDFLPR